MPIWKFNKLTAKHILDHDLTKEYIQCIQGTSRDIDETVNKMVDTFYKITPFIRFR